MKYYPNGQVLQDKFYKDDKLSGDYIEHYIQGRTRTKGLMIDGEMDGKWAFWHHNGQKECEVVCKNGELVDGTVWDDDGNVKVSIRFNYNR